MTESPCPLGEHRQGFTASAVLCVGWVFQGGCGPLLCVDVMPSSLVLSPHRGPTFAFMEDSYPSRGHLHRQLYCLRSLPGYGCVLYVRASSCVLNEVLAMEASLSDISSDSGSGLERLNSFLSGASVR